MSDYMKGYNARNRRRRAASRRRNRGRQEKLGYYSSRYEKRPNVNPVIIVGGAVVVLAVILFLIFSIRAGRNSGKDPEKTVNATGAAMAAATPTATGDDTSADAPEATGQDAGISSAAAAVPTLSKDAIGKPKPKPRPKAVALTFDDGPSTSYTPKILDLLEKYDAHATFFVLGNRASACADILKRELKLGCEIGSHSWDHADLSRMSMKDVNKENGRTIAKVKKITGYKVKLMRPPYGAISDVMRKKLKYPMILWSIDTRDWDTLNAKKVFKAVKKTVSDGDIILVHDIHGSTAEAMKDVIPWLQENGYDILTVSELMERKKVKLKNGVAYGSAK